MNLKKATKPLRFRIVKAIAPKLFQDYYRVWGNPLPRGMVKMMRKKFGEKPLVGAEVGVAYGMHAKSILKTLNIDKLYLVDPYLYKYERFFEAKRYLRKYRDSIQWVIKKSEDATQDIPDGLDFVYIDGDHSYPIVKKDIENYYPKVRTGGVLGGHDFFPRNQDDVVKAVLEFAHSNVKRLYVVHPSDWWFIVS